MIINFKQGILRPALLHGEITSADPYLQINGNSVYVIASVANPIIVNFSDNNNNYLYEETTTRPAWEIGDIVNGPTKWLYWELKYDGEISNGVTQVEPTFGPVLPTSPTPNHHHFLTPKGIMYVWSGNGWESKLRVFAARLGSSILDTSDFPVNISHVGMNEVSVAGYAAKSDLGPFLSSSKEVKVQDSFYNRNKQSSVVEFGTSLERIPKNMCVMWEKDKTVSIASYVNINSPAIGVALHDINRGENNLVITEGYIHDPVNFNWSEPPNTSLFVGKNGFLSTIPPDRVSIQKMGYIVDSNTVYISIGPQILIDGIPGIISEETGIISEETGIINYINPGWINNIGGIN